MFPWIFILVKIIMNKASHLSGQSIMHKFTYIDLFAGCGGLSLGLEKAGFKLELAVEKSDMAAETFYHNFIQRIKSDDQWKKFASSETV